MRRRICKIEAFSHALPFGDSSSPSSRALRRRFKNTSLSLFFVVALTSHLLPFSLLK